jgi:hypothetical protein
MENAQLVRLGQHRESTFENEIHFAGGRLSTVLEAMSYALAFEKLHDEIGQSELVHPIVVNAHDARMGDLVRDVRLLPEPFELGRGQGIGGVHDLERTPMPISVSGRVYRRTPTHAEER